MIPHRLPLIGRITRLILTFSLSIGLFLSIVTNERAVAQVEGVASDGDNLTGGSSVDGRRDDVTHPPAPSPVKHSRETYSEEQRFRSCNREPVSGSHRFMMVVSTLDGKVTAVNGLDGLMQWSLSTGTGPLLSSSISQLIARLIPALDGSLYQLDVDGIEAVPLSAEILLSSSYRFSDDSMVVGGKDIETYALDLTAGKVLYMCSAAGCKYFDGTGGKTTTTGPGYDRFGDRRRTGGPGADRDVLIIKRTGKTVRAVDIQSGLEKWNYSVAQHDLTYLSRSFPAPPTAEDLLQQSSCRHRWAAPADQAAEAATGPGEEAAGRAAGTDEMAAEDESSYRDVTIEDVFEDRYYWSGTDPHASDAPDLTDVTDIDIKVIVPSGLVIAVSRANPDKIYWKYKFDTSIASAWLVDGTGLTDISLFDGQHIPALERNRRLEGDEPLTTTTPSHVGGPGGHSTTEVTNPSHPLNFEQPVIYVGTYNNQLYVQPSVRLTEDLEEERKGATGSAVSMPRVRWKPYIITAPSRTPSVSAHDRYLIGGATDEEQTVETALAPWQDQYPFGYYLYYDYTPIRLPLSEASRHDDDDDNDISASLLVWWKEVAAISILTSLVLHFTGHLIVRRFWPRRARHLSESLLCKYDADQSQVSGRRSARNSESVQLVTSGECDQIINTAASASRESSTSDQNDYISRYLSDFDQRACLGKGGFGVVFSVVNKLDDCEYAIKRITLNDSDTAKEKVTREVKALAKLDHPGIVRYYQSWFERPPPGWQEQMDRICIDMSLATPTNGFNPASLASIGTSQMTDVFSRRRSLKVPESCVNKAKPKEVNPLRPFDMFGSFGDGAGFGEFSGTDAGNSHSVMDAAGDKSCTSTSQRAARCSRKTVSNKNTSNGNCDTSKDISKDWGDESSNGGPLDHLNDDDDDDVSWCDDAPAPDDDDESSLDSGFSLRRPSVHGNSVRSSSDRFNTDDSLEICFCDDASGDNKPVSQSNVSQSGVSQSGVSQSGISQSGVSKSGSVSVSRGRGSACKGSQLAKSLDVSFTHPKNFSNDDSLSIIFSNDASNSPRKNPTAGKSSTETTPKSRCRSAPSSRPNSLSLSGDPAWTNQDAVRDLIDMKKAPPPAKLYLYIQMQLCQRESLKDWLNNHTLNRDKSLLIDMFHQIVSAIDYVHECGLMHRDLKPSNIFFAMNGQIKIGDFGLVTAAASEGGGGLEGMTPMNPRGGKHTDQVGTQLYMSPEQCAGLTYTHKVDIYALGMIFFELYYPFSTQMERVDTLRAVRCLKFPQRFTRELAQQYELVTQLVSHDPSHRPSTHQILEHSLLREHEQSSELLYQRLRRQRTYSSGKSSGGSSAGALTPLVPLENVEFSPENHAKSDHRENHVKSDNGSTSGMIRRKENTKNGSAVGEKINMKHESSESGSSAGEKNQIRENSKSGSIVFEA